jgi:hypothetical protein
MMILNSFYGKDLMNSEMFTKIVFGNKQGTLQNPAYSTFKIIRQLFCSRKGVLPLFYQFCCAGSVVYIR